MIVGTCEICKGKGAKYKCPICAIKFCSVVCFKSHKGSESCVKKPFEEEKSPEKREVEYEYETEDTVMPEKLGLLETDENIKQDLENPFLRQLLTEINFSKNPNRSIEAAMQEQEFVDFVTHCLKVVEDPNRYESNYTDS